MMGAEVEDAVSQLLPFDGSGLVLQFATGDKLN